MHNLTSTETLEFLTAYYRGILDVGLLEPLLKIGEASNTQLGLAAKSFYGFQISGFTPQVAVTMMEPQFPYRVGLLIALGFEQSKLDFVIADTIKAFETCNGNEQLEQDLDALLEKYSHLTTADICLHCSTGEIQKLLNRSEVERSNTVILQYRDGYLKQKYIATKLVEIQESAIPAAYRSLKKTLSDFAASEKPSMVVKSFGDLEYEIVTERKCLRIKFVD
jgi:hypothetical protein